MKRKTKIKRQVRELTNRVLGLFSLYRLPKNNPKQIINAICKLNGVSKQEILGPCRKAELVKIRREIARYLRNEGLSFPKIGKLMNRDHTTIHHALHSKNKRDAL